VAGDVDRAIAAVAARQHRIVTHDQLLGLGLHPSGIKRRVAAGRLHREHRGVYAVGTPASTSLERASAAVLACGPGALLSELHALALWGFIKHWPSGPIEVTVPGDRRPKGIKVHRSATLTRKDRAKHRGIWVTTPARALLDAAPRLTFKARSRAVNEALRSGHFSKAKLAEAAASSHPNARLLQPFVTHNGNPTRSGVEDDFVLFCKRFGHPEPLTDFLVAGREADAYFPEEKLIVELDSWEYHSDRYSFENDRVRDANALVEGIGTLRITPERLNTHAEKESERLGRILKARRADRRRSEAA
jgi:hypothetical protein